MIKRCDTILVSDISHVFVVVIIVLFVFFFLVLFLEGVQVKNTFFLGLIKRVYDFTKRIPPTLGLGEIS